MNVQYTDFNCKVINAIIHLIINCFCLATGGTVSLIVQVEGQKDKFIIGHNNDLEIITWDGISNIIDKSEIYASLESMDAKTRINDGKVDPAGRLWAGNIISSYLLMFNYL